MHCDLKPENFVYESKNIDSPLKAIDFGVSVFFKPGKRFNEIVGSSFYMAPEVIMKDYGPEIDIWSAGVILYILLSGCPPFTSDKNEYIIPEILYASLDFRRNPWPRVSRSAKDLVKRMLDRNIAKRLTSQQVLDHPWILQYAKRTTEVSEVPSSSVV
ncbi:hypothetical protein ZOSMA_62G00480 [Zostera marina]|uniref:Protein kinase domain-containing protein n=1 Tax=Zostera marina TaxID=29655 RepID=A0A0K9NTP3_ZOSMR|nr:hypothetical protein ZOSMA_62G00480 [Zostera marina]